MKDRFGRTISYLRISVTDRCNLRCHYCATGLGISLLPRESILSFEDIAQVARVAVDKGITKVRITGGEPLVRRNIERLVAMLADIDGIQDLAMTTNGVLLADLAAALARAGLHRINVSLDAVAPERYAEVTGGGDIGPVLAGITAARDAGLTPIKLNCVVAENSDEPDAQDVARFARENDLEVRFIPRMDPATGKFGIVDGGSGGDCPRCTRLRLSSDGIIRPCLFSDLGFSVRELGAAGAIERAVCEKPETGGPCTQNWIRAVGG